MRKNHRSLLGRIYAGDFLPCEQIIPQDPEYARTVKKLEAEINAIIERLGDEGRARMDRIVVLMGDIQHIDLYPTFGFGLRTDMQLMEELFVSGDVLPPIKDKQKRRATKALLLFSTPKHYSAGASSTPMMRPWP